MKKYILALALLFLCSNGARAQTTPVITLSAAGTSCVAPVTAGSALIINVRPDMGAVSFTINANAGGNTISFYASGDSGKTYNTLSVTPSNSTTTVTSTTTTTAGSVWRAAVSGYTNVCMLMTTQSSGNTTVAMNPSNVAASLGGGGGGAGTVTSVSGTTNQIDSTGGTTPVLSLDTAITSQLPNTVMTTLGDSIYGGASGVATRLAGPTAQNIPYSLINTPSAGVAQAPAWTLPGVTVNSVPCTANAYTVLNTDRGAFDYSSDASACAVTLPNTTGNFVSNFFFGYANQGAGLVTISPTTAHWNGNTTQIVPNHWLAYGYSDNTNYFGGVFPDIAAFPSCSATGSALSFTTATGALGCNSTVAQATSCSTANAMAVFSSSLTITCGNADFTYATHTLTAAAAGLVDLSAETTATGFKVPVGAGFTSSANGVINYDSTSGNTHIRTNAADSLAVAEASAVASGFIPKSSSATNSLLTATLCDEGITTANTLTCTNTAGLKVASVATGTSPPTCTIGTGGALCQNEGTAPTGAASVDDLYADSTLHCLVAINNNVNDGCLRSTTNGGTYPITIVSGVSGGIPYFSSTTAESASGILNSNILVKGGGAGAAPTNSLITDNGTTATYTGTGGYSAPVLVSTVALGTAPLTVTSATPVANLQPAFLRATMTADWTCGTGGTVSSCTTATIVGSGGGTAMTITLPLSALSWDFDCDGVVGSATGDPANNWNLLTATNAPTNTTASYYMGTAAAVGAFGSTTGNSSTTTFNIGGTWTLGATGTKFPFHIHARIEGASASGTVVSLQLVDPTVGDLLTIYRGMSCWAHQ